MTKKQREESRRRQKARRASRMAALTAQPPTPTHGLPSAASRPARVPAPLLDWAPAYLAALRVSGQKVKSALQAGLADYSPVHDRRQRDPEFATQEEAAMKVANSVLESEAYRRACEGVTRRHYDAKGNLRYEEVVYSDMLLIRALERADPTWRTKTSVDVTSGGRGVFATRSDRKKAIADAKASAQKPLA